MNENERDSVACRYLTPQKEFKYPEILFNLVEGTDLLQFSPYLKFFTKHDYCGEGFYIRDS
jgi:hypothetical protein